MDPSTPGTELPKRMGVAQQARHERQNQEADAKRSPAAAGVEQQRNDEKQAGAAEQNTGAQERGDHRGPANPAAPGMNNPESGAAQNDGPEGPASGFVGSTSDQRTVNNTMRHSYRVLTDAEKAQMQAIKDCGARFLDVLHAIGGTDPLGPNMGSRELALAQTKAEEAVMWAVKHVTA